MNFKDYRPRLRGNIKIAYDNITKIERRILIIGDIHAPFSLDGYLEFCKDVYARNNLNQVIFIGDIIDNHYSSFHSTDPDGLGGADELDYAIHEVAKWRDAFPVADGEGGTARTKSKNDMMSTVQGHIHTQAYCEWTVGRNFRVFGMQVGCGVDGKSYAAAYAKNFKKQAIGCGVVLGGHTAINCLMEL